MVVVLEDLNLSLEFVDFRLHQLLSTLCQQRQVEFNVASFHDLLSEFNCFLFSFLNDLPKLVRENISALMQLFLRLIIFPQVGILIREVIEIFDKFVQNCLFPVMSMQIAEEVTCCHCDSVITLLTLHTDVSENEHHLVLIVLRKVLPEFNDDRLEVSIDIVSLMTWAEGTLADTVAHISAES